MQTCKSALKHLEVLFSWDQNHLGLNGNITQSGRIVVWSQLWHLQGEKCFCFSLTAELPKNHRNPDPCAHWVSIRGISRFPGKVTSLSEVKAGAEARPLSWLSAPAVTHSPFSLEMRGQNLARSEATGKQDWMFHRSCYSMIQSKCGNCDGWRVQRCRIWLFFCPLTLIKSPWALECLSVKWKIGKYEA